MSSNIVNTSQAQQVVKFTCLSAFTCIFRKIKYHIIKIYIAYRFPIEAINNHNDDHHKSNGSGSLCHLHFSSNDLQRFKGRIQLKNGAIPVNFTAPKNQMMLESDVNNGTEDCAQNNNSKSCNDCETLILERDKLKQMLAVAKINSDFEREKNRKEIDKLSDKCHQQSDQIRILREKIRHLEIKRTETKSRIDDLQKNQLSSSVISVENTQSKQLISCLINGILPTQKYPPEVREFCLSLRYHSPRAYDYVRQVFNNNLPHSSTIRKWYANSDLQSEPGISNATLEFLKEKVVEKRKAGLELITALCFDEMSIRQQIIWSPEKEQMLGYVTYGSEDPDNPLIAKEAIVYVISGLNDKFRIPIAYHFVNSLDGYKKAALLKSVLASLTEIGVTNPTVTCDNHATNKKMFEILGANLNTDSTSFQPYITPDGKNNIYIFFDVCHLEKLVRGQMDNRKTLIDENGNKIKWQYLERLVECGQRNGFIGMHKLSQKHLNWRRRPMNVGIAVQTLSRSTADSIDYLRSIGHKDFIDSLGTSQFIRMFDNLFDIFNAKWVHNNPNVLKNAIDDANKEEIFALFDHAINFIKAIKFTCEGGEVKRICRSDKKTGFDGFIINMCALKLLFNEYVQEKKILQFIPTFYLNQDAVETFFGKIRSLGGCNDNPNVVHFQAAYRKLLANDSILVSKKGNCEDCHTNSNPFSDILFVTSKRDIVNRDEEEIIVPEDIEELFEKLDSLNAYAQSDLTEDLQGSAISHIANLIEAKIIETDNCPECVNVFTECRKIENTFLSSKFLNRPCLSTYKICKEADRFMKLQLLVGNINFQTIYYSILNDIEIEQMFNEHNFSTHPTHKLYLIRAIVDGYIRYKGTYIAKNATQDLHLKNFRYKFRKLIHFYGQ